ncbi:MAG: hypothetical protein CSA70_02225 [Rhodobacterales bacterium]|nr:MAG: hypothetical protein CSA70_02225 [Rhodobacterales bacterium]
MHIDLVGEVGVAATIGCYPRLLAAVNAKAGALDPAIARADVHVPVLSDLATNRISLEEVARTQ